jgi:hypothetical protein
MITPKVVVLRLGLIALFRKAVATAVAVAFRVRLFASFLLPSIFSFTLGHLAIIVAIVLLAPTGTLIITAFPLSHPTAGIIPISTPVTWLSVSHRRDRDQSKQQARVPQPLHHQSPL